MGECCYLVVDVGEEGVRAPAAQDLNGLGVIAIEVKGCGPTSAKGVAGYELSWDALAFQVQSFGGFPKSVGDLACVDSIASWVFGAEVSANDGVRCVMGAGSDVGQPPDDCFDWADGGRCGFMVDD